MKLRSEPVPYSSVVGGGLTLLDESGRVAFIVNFMGASKGISKEQTAAMARQIGGYINKHGLEVPDGYPD